MIIETEVYARAGLLGNPSDMYGGKVISFVIKNFAARVRLWESPHLTIRLHPQHDRSEFENLVDLVSSVQRHGYYGMHRILLATCRRFADFCSERGISLPKMNFTLESESDIPRQSGLGGSSAMVIATLRALLKLYRIPVKAISNNDLAELALSVETAELNIAAGLQDRVVQVYGGLTFMNFSKNCRNYTKLNSNLLPRFALAYPSYEQFKARESGQVHSQIRFRWEQGDKAVRKTMQAIAHCAEAGLKALQERDAVLLGKLMNRNFDLRRKLFGDKTLGDHSIRLVETARELNFPSKLPGSGNAVLILLNQPDREEILSQAYTKQDYRFIVIQSS